MIVLLLADVPKDVANALAHANALRPLSERFLSSVSRNTDLSPTWPQGQLHTGRRPMPTASVE